MTIKYFGVQPPAPFDMIKVGGICPHCKIGTRFNLTAPPNLERIGAEKLSKFVAGYTCDSCSAPIALLWSIQTWLGATAATVGTAELIVRVVEPFDFSHVPEMIAKEIQESLDCLSVNAYNGFAALSRRAMQSICTDLGAESTSRVKKQIEQMIEITKLGDEWRELALQVMLSGHDGSHPDLPKVDVDRASVLLLLLRDLVYELYTRPGRIREAGELRRAAVLVKD